MEVNTKALSPKAARVANVIGNNKLGRETADTSCDRLKQPKRFTVVLAFGFG